MTAYTVVVAAGLGSYLVRVSMLVLAARRGLPPLFERTARYAVPTAFAALATGALISHQAGGATLPPLFAVTVAAITVHRTGRPYTALLAGMPTLWVISAVVAR